MKWIFKKIFGYFLLSFGIGGVVFKALEDLSQWKKWLFSIVLLSGVLLVVRATREEVKEEIKRELDK